MLQHSAILIKLQQRFEPLFIWTNSLKKTKNPEHIQQLFHQFLYTFFARFRLYFSPRCGTKKKFETKTGGVKGERTWIMNNEMERRKKNGEDKKNLVKIIYRKQFFSIYSTWAIFLHLVILNFYVPGMNARSECAHDIYVYRRMYSTQHIHYYSAKCFAFFCPFFLAAQRSCWYNWIAEWKDRKIEQLARKNENENENE